MGTTASGRRDLPIYYMQDFYLNFYFQSLNRYSNIIRNNIDQNIFTSKAFLASIGFYMPDYSGQAFELLCKRLLLRKDFKLPLHAKLMLKSVDYQLANYQDQNMQIDNVVEDQDDRITRIVECKWIDKSSKFSEHLQQLKSSDYPTASNFTLRRY